MRSRSSEEERVCLVVNGAANRQSLMGCRGASSAGDGFSGWQSVERSYRPRKSASPRKPSRRQSPSTLSGDPICSRWLDDAKRDLRYVAPMVWNQPGFAAVAVTTGACPRRCHGGRRTVDPDGRLPGRRCDLCRGPTCIRNATDAPRQGVGDERLDGMNQPAPAIVYG